MILNIRYLLLAMMFSLPVVSRAISPADSLRQAKLDSLLSIGVARLTVQSPSADDIRAYIKQHPMLDYGQQPAKYAQQPKVRSPFAPGSLSEPFVQRGLNAVNAMRYIAGLEPNVRVDVAQLADVQAAALLCAATKQAHPTAKTLPAGYDKGLQQQGLRSLVDAMVGESAEQTDRAVVFDLVRDARKAEMPDVARRRTLLSTALQTVAVGQVGKYTVLKPGLQHVAPANAPKMVAWPAQQMPLDYFDVNTPLSLCFTDDYDIKGNVVVVMVRQHDGRVWKFGRLLPKSDGYYNTSTATAGGTSRCIVWRPNGIDQYRPNDRFAIHVSGIKYQGFELPPIEYTVSFFSLFSVFSQGYLRIMEPVSSIAPGAYKANGELLLADVARSVTTIGPAAFAGCIKLERVELAAALQGISAETFKGCVSLKNIALPQTVTEVGVESFAGCAALQRVGISYKLERIDRAAFNGCTALSEIDLPESLREIGPNAFAGCTNLAQISIPKGVSKIGISAFTGCTGLRRLSIEAGDATTLELASHAFQGCTSLDSVSLPGSVVALEEQVFDGCTSLRVVRIGEGTQRIADNAFGRIPLERIYIPASVQQIGRVSAIPTTATIYCPAGSYAEKWAKSLFRKYLIVK